MLVATVLTLSAIFISKWINKIVTLFVAEREYEAASFDEIKSEFVQSKHDDALQIDLEHCSDCTVMIAGKETMVIPYEGQLGYLYSDGLKLVKFKGPNHRTH